MRIIMVGPAGSGKGTQSALLSQKYKIPFISSGVLLRKKTSDGDELAREIYNNISKGNYVSDEIIFNILYNRLSQEDCQNGFILDGFPRNILQAIDFEKFLAKNNTIVDAVLVLKMSRQEVFERTTGRFECVKCKTTYNKFSNNTKINGVCDICNSKEFVIRIDDANIDAINKRLDIYEQMSKDIISYYGKKDLIYYIDALKSISEINQNIEEILTNLNINKREEVTIG